MRVYFWVRSQLGESERKLLRETGGSSDVPLLTCSIHQLCPTTPISDPEASGLDPSSTDVHIPSPMGSELKGRMAAVDGDQEGFLEG